VSDVFSIGYSAEGAFFSHWSGDYPFYCAAPFGAYSAWRAHRTLYDIGIGCPMRGGASGGPWFTSYLAGWDYVASVNSHSYADVPTENLWGPYFTRRTIDLFNAAGG
jgi:hypothetical protein